MKLIQRFLIAILLLTGIAGATYAQRGPGDHGRGIGHHGNPDQLNLSDSCWRVFLSQLPTDSAQMLIRALDCLKDTRMQFDTLWHDLRAAYHDQDSAKIAEIRAQLAALRAQRRDCGEIVKTILRQYRDLIRQVRRDCGRRRHDGPPDHSSMEIKIGPIVPNPVPLGQTTAQFTFGLRLDAHVVITISDALGNVVKEVFNGDLTAGPQTQTLDLSGLSAGMYYLRVQAGDGVGTARLIIQ